MRGWTLTLLAVVWGEYQQRWTKQGVMYEVLEEIEVLENDHREYRLLRLNNSMQVLIGRDPYYDMSLVVMDVLAGLRDDPPGLSGLAHLCEHALFGGSVGYPRHGMFTEVSRPRHG